MYAGFVAERRAIFCLAMVNTDTSLAMPCIDVVKIAMVNNLHSDQLQETACKYGRPLPPFSLVPSVNLGLCGRPWRMPHHVNRGTDASEAAAWW